MRRRDGDETARHDATGHVGETVEAGAPTGRGGEEPFDREGFARIVNGGEE
jgi:hypothetical protein